MLGFVAAALFVMAFLINATPAAAGVVFSATSLMLAGLACLALHLAGVWHELVAAPRPYPPLTRHEIAVMYPPAERRLRRQ